MSKIYVKSKGVFCPSCGRSRGVELLKEPRDPSVGSTKYYIRCKHEGVLYQIINWGVYPTYDSPSEEY
ncbi:MAG: hypothetical protein V1769_00085 [Thermoplasmatota archaeon]